MRTTETARRGTGRWKKNGERYPGTDPGKDKLSTIQKARTDGWRNGARVRKR
jgi:hypothetical protein